MKKQKGGGGEENDLNLQINQYDIDGEKKTTIVNTLQKTIDIINTNMRYFNGRIKDCENRLRL